MLVHYFRLSALKRDAISAWTIDLVQSSVLIKGLLHNIVALFKKPFPYVAVDCLTFIYKKLFSLNLFQNLQFFLAKISLLMLFIVVKIRSI